MPAKTPHKAREQGAIGACCMGTHFQTVPGRLVPCQGITGSNHQLSRMCEPYIKQCNSMSAQGLPARRASAWPVLAAGSESAPASTAEQWQSHCICHLSSRDRPTDMGLAPQ